MIYKGYEIKHHDLHGWCVWFAGTLVDYHLESEEAAKRSIDDIT